ncbi:MAG: outer membrane lipoprotein carrier protein LolA [Spirochaetia bacterium]|nr:outer membrane lipoprotein carrier protein LolA [Spirochaetia bacterium]
MSRSLKKQILKNLLFLITILVFSLTLRNLNAQKFVHPTDVVKKVKDNFNKLNSYQAEFNIITERKNQKKYTKGTAYFKKGGKVNFSFTIPTNDVIISNGKKMWIYIKRLNAVAVQNLKNPDSDKGITSAFTDSGVITLFNRYHYSFDTVDQPILLNKTRYYKLNLKEKVATGGFSEMKVYIDAETFFITKIEADAPGGKKVTLTLTNVEYNVELPNSLFQFNIEDNMKVVENALTTVQ